MEGTLENLILSAEGVRRKLNLSGKRIEYFYKPAGLYFFWSRCFATAFFNFKEVV